MELLSHLTVLSFIQSLTKRPKQLSCMTRLTGRFFFVFIHLKFFYRKFSKLVQCLLVGVYHQGPWSYIDFYILFISLILFCLHQSAPALLAEKFCFLFQRIKNKYFNLPVYCRGHSHQGRLWRRGWAEWCCEICLASRFWRMCQASRPSQAGQHVNWENEMVNCHLVALGHRQILDLPTQVIEHQPVVEPLLPEGDLDTELHLDVVNLLEGADIEVTQHHRGTGVWAVGGALQDEEDNIILH